MENGKWIKDRGQWMREFGNLKLTMDNGQEIEEFAIYIEPTDSKTTIKLQFEYLKKY